jgi:hypothetical protein
MADEMAGRTVSFIADPSLEERVAEIARADGVTRSQAAARASAFGTLLPTAARRAGRFVLEEGDDEAQRQLTAGIAKAIARASNVLLERRLLAQAEVRGRTSNETEEQLEARAVGAVAAYRKESRAG